MKTNKPGFSDFFLLTLLAAIFGASFMFTRIAVGDLPPLTVAAARLLLAFLVLYPLMRIRGQRMPAVGRIWILIIGAALFGNSLPFALITWGQVKVDAGMTAILMAVMPLLTIVLAHFATRDERMNRYKFIGVMTGLLGVVVLIGWDSLGGLGDNVLRQYAIAMGACCYAVNAILTKQLTGIPRLPMMTALMLTATISLIPFSLWMDQPWLLEPTQSALLSVLALALGPTALATLLILDIVDRQGASFLGQINFMVPLFGVFFGAVFLSERLPASAWYALCIILAGIAMSRIGNRRARPAVKPVSRINGPGI